MTCRYRTSIWLLFGFISIAIAESINFQKAWQLANEDRLEIEDIVWAPEDDFDANTTNEGECRLTVDPDGAIYFQHMVEQLHPNFARFQILFPNNTPVNHTPQSILPRHWVWTYYTPGGFFPYLKWPIDFPLLSLGLLDTKSLRTKHTSMYLNIVTSDNCSLILGTNKTTWELGRAFMEFTKKYLLPLDATAFGYSYWCYTKEVPGIKLRISYKLGIHLGIPVEFSRYNCCKTHTDPFDQSKLSYKCIDQIPRMFQVTFIPYMIGLFVFAYFPIIFFTFVGDLAVTDKYIKITHYADVGDEETDDKEWIFLDGKPPVSCTLLAGSLCGLANKHPVTVSRVRRVLFVLFGPVVIYIQIYVYWKYLYRETLSHLKHGDPLGYLSLIGGVERSRSNFAPMLGGPLCLLVVYHVAGILYVLIPRSISAIYHVGCRNDSKYNCLSPFLYNEQTIEIYSATRISENYGYGKVASFCRAGLYMLANYKFWLNSFALQYTRLCNLFLYFKDNTGKMRYIVIALFVLGLPVYVFVCLFELLLCVVFFGIPIVNTIFVIAKGYVVTICVVFRNILSNTVPQMSEMAEHIVVKLVFGGFSVCLFSYYAFSVCTIIIASFYFISEVVVLCLLSVIVYPSTSFGYLFFGIILLYYVFITLKRFGQGYFDLLSLAVEICTELDENGFQSFVENDAVVIRKPSGSRITKLRMHNRMIQLSPDQCEQLNNTSCSKRLKLINKNNIFGVPRALFEHLVNIYRPVHIQIFHACFRLSLIVALIVGTISIVVINPFGPSEGLSEIMHVIFIMAIGALPRILELAIENSNHMAKEDIKRRQMKATIIDFWTEIETEEMS